MTAEWTPERRKRAAENTRLHLKEHGHPLTGKKRTAETRAKISESLKKSMTPERRAKMSEAKKKSMTPEVRARMSEAAKKSMTPERRARMSEAAKKSMTPERRAKLSEASRRSMTPERRAKISEKTRLQLKERGHPMKGKKHKAESLAKMRAAHKKTYESMTPEDRAKLSEARKRAMTPEVRAKLSETKKKNMTPERRARLSEATKQYFKTHEHPMKGKHWPVETKDNMSKAQQKRAKSMTLEERVAAHARLKKGRKIRETTPEQVVRYVLNRAGVDYRPQVPLEWAPDRVPTTVDILVEPNIVIEVDGDYWHGKLKHGSNYTLPGGYTAEEKRAKDQATRAGLERNGFKVIAVLESRLKNQTYDVLKEISGSCGANIHESFEKYGYRELESEAKSYLKKLESGWKREWHRKNRDRVNKRLRERRANDDEYRERQNAQQRKRLHDDPELYAKIKKANNEKYRNDPAYREKAISRSRKRHRENKDEISAKRKDRWANDDDYRNKMKLKNKETHQRRMSEITSKLTDILGGACHQCGQTMLDMKIRTNTEAAAGAGHDRKRGVKMQEYVDDPAMAVRFLHLFCPDCSRVVRAETARRSTKGKKQTDETKSKISKGVKKSMTSEVRAKMSAAQKGRTHTAASKAKMSAFHKGRHPTAETRAKISQSVKKSITPEVRARMSESAKKQMFKHGSPMKGKRHTEEAKAKMSRSHKKGTTLARQAVTSNTATGSV